MLHSRKTRQKIKQLPKPEKCPFCSIKPSEILASNKHCFVTPNHVFYDLWEMREVVEHLMIIPKRHVLSLAELTPAELADAVALMAEYEAKNYNVYARAPNSKQRSVAHQHTHLIKTVDKQAHGQLLIKKPYLLIKF